MSASSKNRLVCEFHLAAFPMHEHLPVPCDWNEAQLPNRRPNDLAFLGHLDGLNLN